MNESALKEILANPDYQVLKRLPEKFEKRHSSSSIFSAVIIDLETMGLNPKADAIIELGLLKFAFTNSDGIIEVKNTYNSLNDPEKPIPETVTKITGITNEDVSGKKIDWEEVTELLENCHLVICHNCGFDRKFLELQTPKNIQEIFKHFPFACTHKDINWSERGFESSKLDYLNWKLGYFYKGHRAIVDCWATLNLLTKEQGAFDELKLNLKKTEILLCAFNAPFDKKDVLKERKYRWSDGTDTLPKSWWTIIAAEELENEKLFLEESIYGKAKLPNKLPQSKITALNRYSFREFSVEE